MCECVVCECVVCACVCVRGKDAPVHAVIIHFVIINVKHIRLQLPSLKCSKFSRTHGPHTHTHPHWPRPVACRPLYEFYKLQLINFQCAARISSVAPSAFACHKHKLSSGIGVSEGECLRQGGQASEVGEVR